MTRLMLALALLLALPTGASAATTTVRNGGVRASAGDGSAALTSGRITRTLRPGASVIGVSSVLNNGSPAPLRVGAYSLDELTSPKTTAANVLTYHGGSDWRDDYRVASQPAGAFDQEGEVVRFDDGTGAGWFFVSERRSGSPSRVGRETGGRSQPARRRRRSSCSACRRSAATSSRTSGPARRSAPSPAAISRRMACK
jgi:hypothetical protein